MAKKSKGLDRALLLVLTDIAKIDPNFAMEYYRLIQYDLTVSGIRKAEDILSNC